MNLISVHRSDDVVLLHLFIGRVSHNFMGLWNGMLFIAYIQNSLEGEMAILTIYLEKPEKIVNDVEMLFDTIRLKCTDLEKLIVKEIDKGKLIDSNTFIDRFGYKLYIDNLSTGCKAALCVLNSDEVINLIECGINARDAIIKYCNQGNIYFDNNTQTIETFTKPKDVKIRIGEFIFTDLDRLNQYIFDEYPYEPYMDSDVRRYVYV